MSFQNISFIDIIKAILNYFLKYMACVAVSFGVAVFSSLAERGEKFQDVWLEILIFSFAFPLVLFGFIWFFTFKKKKKQKNK